VLTPVTNSLSPTGSVTVSSYLSESDSVTSFLNSWTDSTEVYVEKISIPVVPKLLDATITPVVFFLWKRNRVVITQTEGTRAYLKAKGVADTV
jgi:hypothetical protein